MPIGCEAAGHFGSPALLRRAASLGAPLVVVLVGASLLVTVSALAGMAFPPWWSGAVALLGILGVRAQQRALREAADDAEAADEDENEDEDKDDSTRPR